MSSSAVYISEAYCSLPPRMKTPGVWGGRRSVENNEVKEVFGFFVFCCEPCLQEPQNEMSLRLAYSSIFSL